MHIAYGILVRLAQLYGGTSKCAIVKILELFFWRGELTSICSFLVKDAQQDMAGFSRLKA
jgi:hypothetical protein